MIDSFFMMIQPNFPLNTGFKLFLEENYSLKMCSNLKFDNLLLFLLL